MDNTALQTKYNRLNNELNDLKISKAKAETQLETLEKNQADVLAQIKAASKTETIEDALVIQTRLKALLDDLVLKAEALLNG